MGGSFLCRPQAATPLPGCREGAWVPRSEETPLDWTLIVRSSCLGTLSPNKTPHLGEICGLQGEQLVGSLGGLWGPAGHGKVPRGPGCFWRRTLGISPGRVAPPCRRPALRSRGVLHLEAGRMGWGKAHPPLYAKPDAPSLFSSWATQRHLGFTLGLINTTFNNLVAQEMQRSLLETAAEIARDMKLLYKNICCLQNICKKAKNKNKNKKNHQRHFFLANFLLR